MMAARAVVTAAEGVWLDADGRRWSQVVVQVAAATLSICSRSVASAYDHTPIGVSAARPQSASSDAPHGGAGVT